MQPLRIGFLAFGLSIASVASHAAPLSYTNVDVGIISTEIDDYSLDGTGLLLRGAYAFHPSAFGFAEISDIGYDHDTDGFLWSIGLGGHIAATNAVDIVGKLAYLHQKLDSGPFDNAESGYMLAVTGRGFVVDKLEVEAGIRHAHLQDSGNSTGLTGEGRYFFTPNIAGTVLLQVGDNTTFGINARFTF